MILSGKEIYNQYRNGNIWIDDFDPNERLGPNSYNLRLHNELLVYKDKVLDMKKNNEAQKIEIPETGLTIYPDTLYLGRTVERTFTDKFVPMLEGRSSVGRIGTFIHATAGFGDVGFDGFWTLEISCVQPVIIYPYIEICQIYYHTLYGEYELYGSGRYQSKRSGKYQGNNGIQTSRMWMDFQKEEQG